ncbi:hypothetical protein ACIA5C_01600 [Actinoplanes sp. NPDC051343]|uniref:hypothetical protein n=1 Tax=Actinoplanes sp. NPDC051343 TaxID=3363906 RepID=UPI0037AF511C
MNENQLRTSLQHWAQEAPTGEPPIDDLIARGTRRRRRRNATVMSIAGLLTIAVATTVGIGLNASARRQPAAAPTSAVPVRPALTLAAAIELTTSTSFRYESDLVQPKLPGETGNEKSKCTGVIDLATQTGYSKYGLTEHWVINGVRYLKEGNHRYVIGKGDAAEFLTCSGTTAAHGLLTANPLSLLDDLKHVSSVQQGGAGGNPTYAFRSPGITGTVTLFEGRVSSIRLHIDKPGKGDTPAIRRDVTMTLSDYGAPVSRKAPW